MSFSPPSPLQSDELLKAAVQSAAGAPRQSIEDEEEYEYEDLEDDEDEDYDDEDYDEGYDDDEDEDYDEEEYDEDEDLDYRNIKELLVVGRGLGQTRRALQECCFSAGISLRGGGLVTDGLIHLTDDAGKQIDAIIGEVAGR